MIIPASSRIVPVPTAATVPAPAVAAAPTAAPTPAPVATPAAAPADERRFDPNEVAPKPGYFRSYNDVRASFTKLAGDQPDLVTMATVGPSGDTAAGKADRPLFAVTASAKLPDGVEDTRPVIAIVAGMHSDESANPELVSRFVQGLVAGYGIDPQATNLLRTRRIVVVPFVNPDGRAAVEQGFATGDARLINQRKNGSKGGGVDLNRNFDYHWGEVGGDPNPNGNTYRGPSPASESEVQSLQKFLTNIKPAMVLDMHSQGGVVLMPFGHTATLPADDAGFRAIADQFIQRTGYEKQSSFEFGSGGATLKDWAYGTMKVPAFTVETGQLHHQTDRDFANTLKLNLPLLSYATSISDNPFVRSTAPSTDVVTIDRKAGTVAATFAATPGHGTVAGAELIFDLKTPEGAGVALAAKDGAFNGASELVTGTIPAGVAAAMRGAMGDLAYVRARATDGTWGPLMAGWLNAPTPAADATTAPAADPAAS